MPAQVALRFGGLLVVAWKGLLSGRLGWDLVNLVKPES